LPITVKLFSNFQEVAGVNQTDVATAKDVKSLLERLVEKFGSKLAEQLYEPKTSRLRDSVIILVNGHSIKMLNGVNTPLGSGDVVTTDVVAIFQSVGGG